MLDEVLDGAVIAIIDCFVLESLNNFMVISSISVLCLQQTYTRSTPGVRSTLNLLSVASGMHIIVYFTL